MQDLMRNGNRAANERNSSAEAGNMLKYVTTAVPVPFRVLPISGIGFQPMIRRKRPVFPARRKEKIRVDNWPVNI